MCSRCVQSSDDAVPLTPDNQLHAGAVPESLRRCNNGRNFYIREARMGSQSVFELRLFALQLLRIGHPYEGATETVRIVGARIRWSTRAGGKSAGLRTSRCALAITLCVLLQGHGTRLRVRLRDALFRDV